MTIDRIGLKELVEKGSDADLLREMIAFVTRRIKRPARCERDSRKADCHTAQGVNLRARGLSSTTVAFLAVMGESGVELMRSAPERPGDNEGLA